MKLPIDSTLAGVLAFGCAAAVYLAAVLDASSGLGPADAVAAPLAVVPATGAARP